MAFIRKIKKGNAVYLAKVASYREDGKVKQRVLEYIGKEENGKAVEKTDINEVAIENVKRYADIKALLHLTHELNLSYLLGKHHKPIIAMVIAHLLCKGSVVKITEWITHTMLYEELDMEYLTTGKLYEAFDYLNELSFSKVEAAITSYWERIAPDDRSVFVLDVTDTYYSGSRSDASPRRGKEGCVSKLLQIGLVVSFTNGFPILHRTYASNISNIKTLSDLLEQMAALGLPAIIMDRGFYSEANITDLTALGMQVITGMKQTAGIQKKILDKIDRDKIYTAENRLQLKDTVVYTQSFPFLTGKLIVIYNPKIEVLKRDKIFSEKDNTEDIRYVGYSLIYHNTKQKENMVVQKYFDKDVVERSFKSLKSELHLHPIRMWAESRVEAHVKICYLSLCLLSLIQYKCKKMELSAIKVLEELQHVYKVNMVHAKTKKKWSKIVTLSNQQKNILNALKCSV
jgi:hypothetical protein